MAEYKYKYPNESFSGCDMTASIVYSWDDAGNMKPTEKAIKGKSKKNFATHVLGEIQTISYSIHMEKRPVRSIGNVNAKDYVMGPRTIAGSLVFAVFNKHFAKRIMNEHNQMFSTGQAFLVDELPPFNIVVSFANEYGLRSKLVIYGVRLLNEGQVMSVNDVFTENTYQFMATDIEYMNDEMTYQSRDNKTGFLRIQDDFIKKNRSTIDSNDIGRALAHYTDPTTDDLEEISLAVTTNDATRNNPNGRAVFSLSPLQTEGSIEITDSNNEVQTINITGASSYSIQLSPDMYMARFRKSNPSTWRCNSKQFDIKDFREPYDTKKYAPIVEVLTDTKMQVYSNEPKHTHLMITAYKSDIVKYLDIKSRRVTADNLERNQEYEIATCNGPDTITSPVIRVRTFSSFDKPFNDFIRMIETNQHLLQYKELNRYYEIIDRAKDIASSTSNYQSPTDSIVILKQKFETELSNLNPEMPDYNDKYAELTHNVAVCNELIFLSNKVQNNTISIINKEGTLESPIQFFDEAYDNCFEFHNDTTKAEYYRIYKNVSQSAHTANSSSFTVIDGHENSMRYLGKSGVNHVVQALREHVRSHKVEFYCMTVKEKQEKIENDSNKEQITEQNQNKINAILKDELGANVNNSIMERAFMRKVKMIDNAIILDAEITEKEDNYITVNTNINSLLDDSIESNFYLAVAKKNDIVCNDFIYKKKFSNKDSDIILDDIDFALFKNHDYAIWIENEDFVQISNVTTFNMSKEDNMNDRLVFEYELSGIIRDLKSRLFPILPSTTYQSLVSEIEYNEEITKTNIIDKTVSFLLYSGLGESVLIKALSAIKIYIGTIMESDDILQDIKYSNYQLSFNPTIDDISVLIMSFDKYETKYNTDCCSVVYSEDYEGDYIITVVFSPDLKYKSKVIFINKSNNTMEVL